MEQKSYIVIDDQDQLQRMEQFVDKLIIRDGYKVKHFYFNPTDRDYRDEKQDFDIAKFIDKIRETTNTYHINVIACDYEYSGIANHNGLTVIKALRTIFKCSIILYSGKEQKVIKDIVLNINNPDDSIKPLRDLLDCKIELFLGRDTYPESIVQLLKKKYNYKEIVLKKLSEYPELKLNFSNEFFLNKPIKDLMLEINNDSLQGNLLIGEILEWTIAHFANMNNNNKYGDHNTPPRQNN